MRPSRARTLPTRLARLAPSLTTLRTLAAGAAGGLLFSLVGLPIPWLGGAIAATALLAIAGVDVGVPQLMRPLIFVLLGISIGAAVGPETLPAMARWPASIAILVLYVPVAILASYAFFRLFARTSPSTALFASTPGSLAFVLAYASGTGADMRSVVVTQSVRLVVLVLLLPLAVVPAVAPAPQSGTMATGFEQIWLFAAASAGAALVAWRLRIAAAPLIGAMLVSAALHASDLNGARLPPELVNVGMVALGCMIGARFHGARRDELARVSLLGIGAAALALALSAGFAFVVNRLLGLGFGQAMLAFAPGGVEAMTLIAINLDLDPAYVGVHHVARIVMMPILIPLFARWLLRGGAGDRSAGDRS